MSRCSPIFRHIYPLECKIKCSKLINKLFLALPRVEISSLSNFQKICLNILVGESSFYGNRLSSNFMKKITSGKTLVLTFQMNIKYKEV